MAEGFDDGVWLVELAPLSDPDLVLQEVASVLSVSETPGIPLVDSLLAHLRAREVLLVLDNCEHLVAASASVVVTLLRSCPRLSVLATSREALGVEGEIQFAVPPLSLPDLRHLQSVEDLSRYEAARLFVERVAAARPDFALTGNNFMAVAQICSRLDGIPLALELAAARARVLSVEQISSRLERTFGLLAGGDRTAIPHHRTLGATLDWSYGLLTEEEQTLLRRLAVFAGGFTFEAAETIGAGEYIAEYEVLDLLASLVDKSLVLVEEREAEARYRMLETVREYAAGKLGESAEQAAVGRRHAGFFLALAEKAKPGMAGPEQTAWLERLEREHDNLRAALGRLWTEGEAESGLRLASALMRFWWLRDHNVEGRAWLERLLDLSPATPVRDDVRAKALQVLGALSYLHADSAAGDWIAARSRLEESLLIHRRLGNERRVAAVLQTLGHVNAELGEQAQARSILEESLEIGRRSGDENGIAHSLFALGMVRVIREDFTPARALLEESLTKFRELEDSFWIGTCLYFLAYIDCEEGEYSAARSRFWQIRETLSLEHFTWVATYILEGFARLAAAEGHPERALRLGGATAASRLTFGGSIGPARQATFACALKPAWDALGEEKGKASFEEGRAMTLEEAVEYALGAEEAPSQPKVASAPLLSDREVEVLRLVAKAMTDPQVAKELYVSPRTVGHHLSTIYRKLGVPSRAAAATAAVERRLI